MHTTDFPQDQFMRIINHFNIHVTEKVSTWENDDSSYKLKTTIDAKHHIKTRLTTRLSDKLTRIWIYSDTPNGSGTIQANVVDLFPENTSTNLLPLSLPVIKQGIDLMQKWNDALAS